MAPTISPPPERTKETGDSKKTKNQERASGLGSLLRRPELKPAEIVEEPSHVGPDGEITLQSDVAADGSFGERTIKITSSRVCVTSPNGALPHVDLDISLSDLSTARTDALVGSGVLQLVKKDGTVIEAIRYTQAFGPQFNAAARAIDAYIKEETPSASLFAGVERRVCKSCGLPLPEDTQVCNFCLNRRATLLRLLSYGATYKMQAVLIVGLSLVGIALGLITPILTTRILTDKVLIPHQHGDWILYIVITSIVLLLVSTGLGIWRGRIAAWLSNHMVYRLRMSVYNKLQSLSISYYDKRQVGTLMARVTQDVNELQSFLVDGVQYFFINSVQIIGILIMMLIFNAQLTLLALIPVPLTIYLTRKLWRMLFRKLHRLWHLRSSLSGLVNAALTGVRVVKAFAQEGREKRRFEDKATTFFQAQVTVEQAWATYFPILAVVATAGTFVINYYGGNLVYHNPAVTAHVGASAPTSLWVFIASAFTSTFAVQHHDTMTLGTLQLFLFYLGSLMGPIQGMTRIADWLSRSTAAAERVFEVLDADLEVDDASNAVSIPRIKGRVELKNVYFSYDKNKMVLDDVSLDVAAGEMIGLVGHSGAGKSTIINLLSRFYDVNDGSILIDGVDIKKIKMEDLRRQIGVVLQEPFLFPGTVRENIAYAKTDAPIEEIMRAAKAANAHDFVMRLPDGYDTWVGERGARLSGGERQRISIARAILHDPRILILDEATASVDTETEKQIQEAIARLIQGRTTFAIAHRLSTLREADRLVVMEKGKIVELGTHDELLAMPEGVYKRLVDMQQSINKLKSETVVLEG